MVNIHGLARSDDRCQIEPTRHVPKVFLGKVLAGRFDQPRLFLAIQAIGRRPHGSGPACFDLNKNEGVPVPTDEVQLPLLKTPVAFQHAESLLFEVTRCGIFTEVAAPFGRRQF